MLFSTPLLPCFEAKTISKANARACLFMCHLVRIKTLFCPAWLSQRTPWYRSNKWLGFIKDGPHSAS